MSQPSVETGCMVCGRDSEDGLCQEHRERIYAIRKDIKEQLQEGDK